MDREDAEMCTRSRVGQWLVCAGDVALFVLVALVCTAVGILDAAARSALYLTYWWRRRRRASMLVLRIMGVLLGLVAELALYVVAAMILTPVIILLLLPAQPPTCSRKGWRDW